MYETLDQTGTYRGWNSYGRAARRSVVSCNVGSGIPVVCHSLSVVIQRLPRWWKRGIVLTHGSHASFEPWQVLFPGTAGETLLAPGLSVQQRTTDNGRTSVPDLSRCHHSRPCFYTGVSAYAVGGALAIRGGERKGLLFSNSRMYEQPVTPRRVQSRSRASAWCHPLYNPYY